MRYQSTVPVEALHARSICDADTDVACTLDGGDGATTGGAAGVVADASFENAEQSVLSHAFTRYVYVVVACTLFVSTYAVVLPVTFASRTKAAAPTPRSMV